MNEDAFQKLSKQIEDLDRRVAAIERCIIEANEQARKALQKMNERDRRHDD